VLLVLILIAALVHRPNSVYHRQSRQISSRSKCMDSEQRFKPVDQARKKHGVTRSLLVAPAQTEGQAVVVCFISDGWLTVVAIVESQLEVKVGKQVDT